MRSNSVELDTSEPKPELNAQTITQKKGRWRRLASASVIAIIVSVALWSMTRVEGVPEADAEVDATLKLGSALGPPGKTDDGATAIRFADAQERGDADAQVGLGLASPENTDLDTTIAECRESVRQRPGDADAQAKFGALLIAKGEFDEAIGALRAATRLKPGRSDAHCKLGKALSAQGKLAEATGELRETIRLEPGNVDAHNFLGEALARQGKIDEATEHYLEADRLKYDPSIALTSLKAMHEGAVELPNSNAQQRELDGGACASSAPGHHNR